MTYRILLPLTLSALLISACAPTQTSTAPTESTPIQAFTAFGTKEAWRAVVDGQKIILEGKEIQETEQNIERQAYAKGVEFTGKDKNTTFTLNIRTAQCQDQNGRNHPFSATLYYGDKTFKGCADQGVHEYAPT